MSNKSVNMKQQSKSKSNLQSSDWFSKNKKALLSLACISLAIQVFILLIPYLTNELWWDDSLGAQMWAAVHRFDISLSSYTWMMIKGSLQSGRILFASTYGNILFYIFHSTKAIRYSDVFLILINVWVYVLLLRKLKASNEFILIFLVCLFALFRITPYYDPIASLTWFYPSLSIMLCCGFIFLLCWQETGKSKYLWMSAWIVFASMLCYELSIFYFPVAMYFIYRNKKLSTTWMKDILIILVPCILFLILNFIVRMHAVAEYSGIQVGSLDAVPITYLKQLYAALPGAFYLAIASDTISLSTLWGLVQASSLAGLLIFTSVVALSLFLFAASKSKQSVVASDGYKLALVFIFMPSLVISFSGRYQSELTWGIGYLPVYFQYFGLAILLSGCIIYLVRLNKGFILFLVPLVSVFIAMNWTLNTQVADSINARWWSQPSLRAQAALQPDLFAALSDGDVVEIETISDGINGTLIYELSGKRVSVPDERGLYIKSSPYLLARPNAKHFKLHATIFGNSAQWVLTPLD